MGKLLKTKTVKTDVEYVTRAENIKITQKDIDELNQKIIKDITENEIKREKGLEVAAKCVMK